MCDKTDVCKQYKSGGKEANCRNIVIGRDRESLEIAILCGKKHKGALPLPFDDGVSIIRPRKGKGAAMANPSTFPIVQTSDPLRDYLKEIEKLFKKHELGIYGNGDARFSAIEARLINLEKASGISGETIAVSAGTISNADRVGVSCDYVDIDKMSNVQETPTIEARLINLERALGMVSGTIPVGIGTDSNKDKDEETSDTYYP
jgi:hypothetical protein